MDEEFFHGFSQLKQGQRLRHLAQGKYLTLNDLKYLKQTGTPKTLKLLNQLTENVIGCFQLPLGVAPHFKIDGKEYLIPMAVEETSIIAAASGTAKWLRQRGIITTKTLGYCSIGQIQLPLVKDIDKLKERVLFHKEGLIKEVNEKVIPNFLARGGGVQDIIIRSIRRDNSHHMVILHVLIHTCDAMGANVTTQVCEYLKTPIQKLTKEKVALCILSNLADHKLTRASIVIEGLKKPFANGIVEAGLFAELDPYRAATHNKGILNGIDAVLIATGNDWRAVEAGMHAFASRSGQYKPLTRWKWENNQLHGVLEGPISVGTVGGVTSLHPTAQLCLRLLRIKNADQLSRIVAAVGLIQNLAALRALTTDGIVKGHMKLHLNNLLLATGAQGVEAVNLKIKMEEFLKVNHKITLGDAIKLFKKGKKN